MAVNPLVSRCKAPIKRLLPHKIAAGKARKGTAAISKANAEVHKAILNKPGQGITSFESLDNAANQRDLHTIVPLHGRH